MTLKKLIKKEYGSKKVTKVITPKETKIVKHEMETPIIIPDEIVAEEPIVEEVETETLPELDTVELVEEEETAKPLDEVVGQKHNQRLNKKMKLSKRLNQVGFRHKNYQK